MIARYQRFNDIRMFRLAGLVKVTFRLRAWDFWTVGLSCYVVNPVRDITLHLGVISIGVKWAQSSTERYL